MKKSLVIFASLLVASSMAFASKARVSALQGAFHVVDFSRAFTNPSDLHSLNDQATLEYGGIPVTSNPNAEGGILKSSEGTKYAFILGKQLDSSVDLRTNAGTALGAGQSFLLPQNNFQFLYAAGGDMKWGAGLHYSSGNKVSVKAKQSELAASFGFTKNDVAGYIDLGLGMTAEGTYTGATSTSEKAKFTETPMALGATYTSGTMNYRFDYASVGTKVQNNAGTDVMDAAMTSIALGAHNNHLIEGNSFFYGVNYMMYTEEEKVGKSKVEATMLPFIAGMEATVTPWLVARGSITQNVLLGSTKTTTAGVAGETDTISNNVTVAGGLGFKFGKLLIDGTLCANANGVIGFSAGSFVQQASLTYNF